MRILKAFICLVTNEAALGLPQLVTRYRVCDFLIRNVIRVRPVQVLWDFQGFHFCGHFINIADEFRPPRLHQVVIGLNLSGHVNVNSEVTHPVHVPVIGCLLRFIKARLVFRQIQGVLIPGILSNPIQFLCTGLVLLV